MKFLQIVYINIVQIGTKDFFFFFLNITKDL